MKQTFTEYVSSNPLFLVSFILSLLLWAVVYFNQEQYWLWALAGLLTLVCIVGLIRNLSGKDGLP